MSKRIQVTFPRNPIIARLGQDHSTVIVNGHPVNLASIKALGCEVSESSDLLYKWGDKIVAYDALGHATYNATFIGTDDHDRRFAIVQEETGTVAQVPFTQIKHATD